MGRAKKYTEEFRVQASRMVVEGGFTVVETSKRLGVSTWSLRHWIEKHRKAGVLPPAEQPVQVAEEMKNLRKENARLRLENEILKKAAAYFAKESL